MKKLLLLIILIIGCATKLNQPIQNMDEDMKFVFVQGGSFEIGDLWNDDPSFHKESGNEIDYSPHIENVNDFYIGKYEVTNAQFATFLNEYGSVRVKEGEQKGRVLIGWLTTVAVTTKIFIGTVTKQEDRHIINPTYPEWGIKKEFLGILNKPMHLWKPKPGYESLPVVGVTVYGAYEFCKFYGYRLPNNEEWEYAARSGGKMERWSGTNDINTIDEYAFLHDTTNFPVPGYEIEAGEERYFDDILVPLQPVGEKKSNSLGIFDMTGNAAEWCKDPTKKRFKFIRGRKGSKTPNYQSQNWYIERMEIGSDFLYVYHDGANVSNSNWGFRCAKDK